MLLAHGRSRISVIARKSQKLFCIALIAVAAGVAGCRQDMHNQPKYIPLRASEFYPDGRSARMPVDHTIARGNLREDQYYYTGKNNGVVGDGLPNGLIPNKFADMNALVHRGQERFNIYCTPCHSRMGDGNGMIVQRGLKHPPSYHEDRLKRVPLGYFFDVMSNGFGAMLNYKAQVTPEDRWAIATYIRTLQLSQNASIDDVPADQRAHILSADQLGPVHVPNIQLMNQDAASTHSPAPQQQTGQPQPLTHEGTGVPPQQQKPETQRPQTPKTKQGGPR
jgi:mono/diheme cytochrome c family protein